MWMYQSGYDFQCFVLILDVTYSSYSSYCETLQHLLQVSTLFPLVSGYFSIVFIRRDGAVEFKDSRVSWGQEWCAATTNGSIAQGRRLGQCFLQRQEQQKVHILKIIIIILQEGRGIKRDLPEITKPNLAALYCSSEKFRSEAHNSEMHGLRARAKSGSQHRAGLSYRSVCHCKWRLWSK